ncbi:hypothetical protein [Clostridium sp. DMHC 10]|nr:hypothetical protein [Clostridium sp. DMHC 10]
MMKHLEESTDIVNSNKRLLMAIGFNGLLLYLLVEGNIHLL